MSRPGHTNRCAKHAGIDLDVHGTVIKQQALPTAVHWQERVRSRLRRVAVPSSARIGIARPSLPLLPRASKPTPPVEWCDILYAGDTAMFRSAGQACGDG